MKNFMYTGALLAVIALSACSNDLDKNSEWGNNEVRFKSYIAGNVDTRVANGSNAWEDGDKVGIFMTKSGEALAGTQTAYTADSKGNLTAQGTALKFPDTGTADFYAYYPYADGLTDNNVPVDVTDQTKHIDLLYSKTADVASSTDAVNLGFKHQLTYVVLNITSNGIDASQVKVALKGTLATGTFNLSDGTLTTTGSAADINFNSSTDGKTAAAIVLPATSVADAKLVFTLGDRTIEKALPVTSLNAGTKYTIPVTLTDGSISFGEATIADWTTGVVTGNVDVDFGGGETPTPPATEGDGTKAKPYSVAQVLKTAGDYKKDDNSAPKGWVKAYIVGYSPKGANYNPTFTIDGEVYDANIIVADNANETNIDNVIPVQLPAGEIRSALNLKDNPSNLKKEVLIYGYLRQYFGKPAVSGLTAASLDGGKTIIGTDPGDGGETPVPTTDYLNETFEKGEGNFTIEDEDLGGLSYVWKADTSYGYMKAAAFANNTNHAAESWLVSPLVDLSKATAPVLTFDQVVNYFTSIEVAKTEATVWVKVEGGDYSQVTVNGFPTSLGWKPWANSSVDLSSYKGKKIYFAFKYTSTADKAGTWEIKNVKVAEK